MTLLAPLRRPLDAAMRVALDWLMYFPSRKIAGTPADVGLEFRELSPTTGDGERLGAWWIPARAPRLGHLLFCHGNGGNIGDRIFNAALLTEAGFDVLLFDYRGYGASTGSADEQGTHRDARAALAALLAQPEVDPARIFYLGESLGGAIALELAIEHPPRGVVLQSTFTSVRDLARHHYPLVPNGLVPDAYPSGRLIGGLRAPLLVIHGDRDQTVPLRYGRALFDAAPQPKQLEVFPGGEHDLALSPQRYARVIAQWAKELA